MPYVSKLERASRDFPSNADKFELCESLESQSVHFPTVRDIEFVLETRCGYVELGEVRN